MLDEGSVAPRIALATDDGGTFRLPPENKAVTVVYFYPKDDTEGCTLEARDFSRLAAEFRAAGAEIVGISPDSVASHCRFRDKHELSVRLAADVDKKAAEAFGVWVEKQMYGRRFMGVERSTFLIDGKGRVARAWGKVRVPGHAEEVLAAVRAMAD